MLAGPGDHLPRLVAGLDAAEADLAEQGDAGVGEFGEIGLDHALFQHRRAGQHLHPGGAEVVEAALGEDGHGP